MFFYECMLCILCIYLYLFNYLIYLIIYLNLCIGRVVGGSIPLPNIWPELGM